MLSSFKRGVITLVKNALKGENSPLPEDFDYSKLYRFAISQHILPIVYCGGRNDAGFIAHDEGRKIYGAAMYYALANQNRFEMLDEICRTFEKNGIDYMPLKGATIKDLYPSRDLRLIGDADILIKDEQSEDIEKIMTALGYEYEGTSNHEWIWHKDDFEVELHKRMIPSYTKDLYARFGDGWSIAKPKTDGGHEYFLDCEEELIYLVSHFTKHYRYAGIGIKHLVDIYVFLGAHPELDAGYVNAELDRLGIGKFYQNVKRTLDVWFDGAEGDEVTEFITNKIFSGDAYGTQEAHAKYEAAAIAQGIDATKARNRKFWGVVFPSYKNMCKERPWLKKCPILLPFAWIVRLIRVVLFRRDNIKKVGDSIAVINDTDIDSYKSELRLVGLDFNFEV